MMFHGSLAGSVALTNMGTALGQMMRYDLAAKIMEFIPMIGKYSNDGLNMLIEHGWVEEPFSAAVRKKLSESSPGNLK